jgi:hypothetical protein
MGDEGEPHCQELEPSTKRIIALIYLYARRSEAIGSVVAQAYLNGKEVDVIVRRKQGRKRKTNAGSHTPIHIAEANEMKDLLMNPISVIHSPP